MKEAYLILSLIITTGCSDPTDVRPMAEDNETVKYVIAVKREQREIISADWLEEVNRISGVTLENSVDPNRATVHATTTGIEKLKEMFDTCCHIEPIIDHTTKY